MLSTTSPSCHVGSHDCVRKSKTLINWDSVGHAISSVQDDTSSTASSVSEHDYNGSDNKARRRNSRRQEWQRKWREKETLPSWLTNWARPALRYKVPEHWKFQKTLPQPLSCWSEDWEQLQLVAPDARQQKRWARRRKTKRWWLTLKTTKSSLSAYILRSRLKLIFGVHILQKCIQHLTSTVVFPSLYSLHNISS